ncbi:glycosyltransferase family 2 protein [Intrasporangium sp. DVR]|uniref:glycosyltransferase family 2 protein n=1 Tax=Intrasporangium sp. DVR TaxID=3127867 RepID=UPI00333FA1A1
MVTAVVIVRNGAPWLTRCLDALASQTAPPARLVIVDVASTDTSVAIAQAHSRVRQAIPDVRVHRLERPTPTGRVIDAAVSVLDELPDPARSDERGSGSSPDGRDGGRSQGTAGAASSGPHEWIWVLEHSTAPRPTALQRLLDAVGRSPSVGLAGPKIVDADDPRRLVSLGVQVTRTGRLIASPEPGEADQGQHDKRTDVLAVSTTGMLIRRDVHTDLGGFDPAFDDAGADLDLGWRAQLAGHRVVVVPGSAALEASSGLQRPAPQGSAATHPAREPLDRRRVDPRRRRAARRVALARCSLGAMPFMAAWIVLSSLAAALVLILAKRPRAAWRELGDVAALFRPARVLGARWRARRTRRLRGGDLGTLFVSPLAAARSTVDHIHDAITPERSRTPREASPTTETGPASEETEAFGVLPPALPQRLASHPGFLAVATTLLISAVAWRDAIRAAALSPTRTGVAGGELRPVATDASGLWSAFRDSWHGAGLGTSAESGPHLAVLSGITWVAELLPGMSESRSSAGVTLAWLLFLAPTLSAWSAYLAARVVTPSRVLRAVVALAWAASSVVTTAISEGRLTAALGHVLLPLVMAGFALAARRDATYTATFATALAAAVLAAVVPPFLAVSSVLALGLLLFGPGTRRVRALVLLLVPPALLGTWVAAIVDDWRLLLSGPGLLSTAGATEPWWLLLGHPGESDVLSLARAGQELVSGLTQPEVVVWATVPLVVVGVLGFAVRTRGRAEMIGVLVTGLLGLVGLAAALTSGRVALGSAETAVGISAPAHLWAGVGLELWTAAILVGLLLAGREAVADRANASGTARPDRWRAARSVTLGATVIVPVLVMLGAWGVSGVGRTLTVGEATLPAVAVEQSKDPSSNRLLLLRPSEDVVDFVLVGREPGDLLRDLDRPANADGRPLVDAVARLVGGRSADALDASELADWGVAFVQAKAAGGAPLTRRLDATRRLSRLGTSEQGILWKVLPPPAAPGAATATAPSRLRIVDPEGLDLTMVPTNGPHGAAESSVPAGSGGRHLVVAETVEWSEHAVVTVDGGRLVPDAGEPLPTYELPEAGGLLRVDLSPSHPWVRLGQGLVLAFVVFMALPFGNRRSRRPQS